MDIQKLAAEKRESGGTRAARRLRREGKLPGIIYGHGEQPEAIAVSQRELSFMVDQGAHVLELSVSGADKQVLIKDVQLDPISAEPVHVDFTLVDLSERVEISVPLEYKGTPIGINEGGMLDQHLVDVEIECKVSDIPESIRVVIDGLNIGDSLYVSDLKLPPDVTAVTSEDTLVCSVQAKAAEVEEEVEGEEGEEAGPEIIGRKTKEEEEGDS